MGFNAIFAAIAESVSSLSIVVTPINPVCTNALLIEPLRVPESEIFVESFRTNSRALKNRDH
ncbi:hypothetical protein CI610_02745 [invertebrate metagenome]|uniref:Uncharacterized protein n=1 Tax=invertebrate metagenome TaxID=1711999 RepID=A0A2H9T542_9ZZZZ